MFQTTLNRSIEIRGIGLHTGKESRIIISPSTPNRGIVFNFNGKEILEAKVDLVTSTNRGTILGFNGYSLYTVEHILSALNGMEIDNVEIIVDGEEIPSCDGSAKVFVEKIKEVGIDTSSVKREIVTIPEPIWIINAEKSITAIPSEKFSIYYMIEFPKIGKQWIFYEHSPSNYETNIAPARTFGFEEEIESLLSSGLAKGGNYLNSIIVGENGYSTPLRYPDELVRHKVLDLMGDLYLLGRRINATIIVIKGGHNLHVALVKKIKEVINDR